MTRFGLLHLFEAATGKTEKQFISENIEMMEHAEAIGLDEAWFAEHHFTDYGVMPSIQILASYMASRTKNIRLGTGVTVLPFHNPVRLAEEYAFLDVISDGRIDFGVGRGYQPYEYEAYGIPFTESRTMFDESLEIIQRAWTNEKFSFEGKHYKFKDVPIRPRPVQNPHPPIFGASFNPDTIKFQGEKGLNLLFTPLSTPSDKITEYRQVLQQKGHDPNKFRIGGLVYVYVDEDRERALKDFEEGCMNYFRQFTKMIPAKQFPTQEQYYISLHGILSNTLEMYDKKQVTFDWIVNKSAFSHAFLVGDPAYVADKLQRLQSMYTGLTDVLCWTRLGGLDHKKVMSSMQLMMDKVVKPARAKEAGKH
ncbi:MAG: LLM class flavin-dependent oxidoreductase [Kofleriaceae bacterium]